MGGAAIVALASLLGFLVPGYLGSILLGSEAPLWSAFPVSLLVLFQGVLLLDVMALRITFASVCSYALVVTAVLAGLVHLTVGWRAVVRPTRRPRTDVAGATTQELVLLGCVVAAGLMMLVRYLVQPVSGVDTPFRWDFLARQILAHARLGFYPALTPDDYRIYFYPDAIPPAISISYWWMYAAYGRYAPALTVIPVLLQYACVTGFTFHAAANLHSKRAGYLAAAILASSPLFYRAVFIGQETGLTALSMASMLFFLVSDRNPSDIKAAMMAGLCAALGALSREYGWAWIGIGLVTLVWRRARLAAIATFLATAVAAAGPWYLRTWLRTGDPLYPLAPGMLFPRVNPVYSGFLKVHSELLGLGAYSASQWWEVTRFLLCFAPMPIILGVLAGAWLVGRSGFLTFAAVMLVGVWLQSVGYTSGGLLYATRVLSPALVVLALLAALALAKVSTRPEMSSLSTAAIALSCAWTLLDAVAFPIELRTVSLEQALKTALQPQVYTYREARLPGIVSEALPAGTRILSDNAYAHAALQESPYEVVPTWSPEVGFLFDPQVMPSEARRLLVGRNIRAALFNRQNPTGYFYFRHRYFIEDAPHWTPLARSEMGSVLFALPGADGQAQARR